MNSLIKLLETQNKYIAECHETNVGDLSITEVKYQP